MMSVARNSSGGAAILLAGANEATLRRRIATVLAALRAGVVSVLVTDLAFARDLLRAHAYQLTHAGTTL